MRRDANERAAAAVLIGNGPSLNAIDCSRLGRFATIAFNRSWIAWDDWGFVPRWYACLNDETVDLMAQDFPRLLTFEGVERFFLHPAAQRHMTVEDRRLTFVEPAPHPVFAGQREDTLGDFGNVGATALQILCSLGISKVLMVGVDGHYVARAAEGPDINHFASDYAPSAPTRDLQRFTRGWPAALAGAAASGMEVRNASPGSRVEECPTVDFEQGLAWLAGGLI